MRFSRSPLFLEYTVHVTSYCKQDDNEDDVDAKVPGVCHLVHDALQLDVVRLDVCRHLEEEREGPQD